MTNVSFTGAVTIKGTSKEISKISRGIIDHNCRKNYLGPITNMENFEELALSAPNNAELKASKGKYTMLYATKDDAKKLSAFIAEGNNNFVGQLEDFYKKNISKYIDVPKKSLSGKKVLKAIEEGSFNFTTLKIEKQNILSFLRKLISK